MFYEDVFRKLVEGKIRFAVAGGIALVLHGAVRFTADLDLIVKLSEENMHRFIAAMNELGYKPKLPVKAEDLGNASLRETWANEKNMTVFTFYHPDRPINQIDVFIREPLEYDMIEKELTWITARDVTIPVVSIPHLRTLKKMSGRQQDIADIEALDELEKTDE